ncbi:MAG: hypothetical protein GX241_06490 [Ruminococcaceae bacterium]|nr:hypothetical protein [Oscillospiraceae bacterium]
MKIIKKIIVAIIALIIALFTAFMVLPLDNFIAEKAAISKGYVISESYKDIEDRYYYNRLSKLEKEAYRIVYASIYDFPEKVVVPSLSDDEFKKVFCALSYDNPDLFFLDNKFTLTSLGSVNYFIPHYALTKEDYENKIQFVNTEAEKIIIEANKFTTEYDKELYVHDYLASVCQYANNTDKMACTIYGLLIDGHANCEGYSRTAQFIFNKLGIKNHLVTGMAFNEQGVNEGHMWNVVKIDGKSYNLDITWDDYSFDEKVNNPDNSPSHIYFNISTKDLSVTHEADSDDLWAECTAESYGYFRNKGLLFSKVGIGMENAIRREVIEVFKKGNRSIEIAFTDIDIFNEGFNFLASSNGKMYNIILSANEQVPTAKIDPEQIQYSKNEDNLIIRFFFVEK